ncbi:hypothetical protein HRbin30_01076 [bacterium HR30]|nr:hypothetical protein HRbin30_01076 [bacterium HR30]
MLLLKEKHRGRAQNPSLPHQKACAWSSSGFLCPQRPRRPLRVERLPNDRQFGLVIVGDGSAVFAAQIRTLPLNALVAQRLSKGPHPVA